MANTSNDIITIYSNTGLNVGVPASTTIGGQLVYTFNSTYSYGSGVLEVNIVDAEGGVKVGFNDVELYSLKDDDNQVSVFTVRLPEIVVGTNKIQIWSATSDGAILKGLIVKAGVKQNIARTGKINKIIDKVKQLYDFYNTTTVEGIAGLPPIPTKLGKRSKLAKSKIDELKNLVSANFGSFTCHYYNSQILNDEVISQIYNKITNYLPEQSCYSCDAYSSCDCNAVCYFDTCSCYDLCDGYSSCVCNMNDYGLSCGCYQVQYGGTCTCHSVGYEVCNCHNWSYNYCSTDGCDCNTTCDQDNTCLPYYTCICDGVCHNNVCNCDHQSDNSSCTCNYICDSDSCLCNSSCNGFSECSCDNRCYQDTCPCNTRCNSYTCGCNSGCNYGYSCGCNYTGYATPSCGCFNTCYTESCSCNSSSYDDCFCDDRCYNFSACSCNYSCDSDTCPCDSSCDGYTCGCYSKCYLYDPCSSYGSVCQCNSQVDGTCACVSGDTYPTCECNGVCDVYDYQCGGGACYYYTVCSCNNTCDNESCTCDSRCHGFSSCDCYDRCYANTCDCNFQTYGFQCQNCYSSNYSCQNFNYNCQCDVVCDNYDYCPTYNSCSNFSTCDCFSVCYDDTSVSTCDAAAFTPCNCDTSQYDTCTTDGECPTNDGTCTSYVEPQGCTDYTSPQPSGDTSVTCEYNAIVCTYYAP